jgi:hypothetical protein
MAESLSQEERLKRWWDGWRKKDYSWGGLAQKEWAGFSVTADGFVVETESGAVYGLGQPGAGEAGAPTLRHPGSGEAGAQDPGLFPSDRPKSLDPGLSPAASPRMTGRPATLQDYWRADPGTGRLRSEDELIAAGELIRRPAPPAETAAPNLRHPGAGEAGAQDPGLFPSDSPKSLDPGLSPAASPRMTADPETYHIAHLPLQYKDETPTGKADWPQDRLDPLLRPRLAAAGETTCKGPWYDRTITSPDRRAQLDGCVLLAV